MAPIIILISLALIILFFILYKKPKKKIKLSVNYKELLKDHVSFYRLLNKEDKTRFEEKIKEFLSYVLIEGVNTSIDDLDKLLVASSAVIPVFGFSEWKYFNLNNVLLYPETFNREEFLATGFEKNTLGMVGSGAMQRMMILSKPALHYGFENESGKENTGIHEFVHLLDKEDGDVDGLPEVLLNKKYNAQWLELVNKNIDEIVNGYSDISSYGATNKAEFFAVASEYFFSNPRLFKENHSELYEMMVKIFNQRL
ncbi:MAG: zinc-dependent peptidase [Bacteroidota bacterium]|nr:zinc-dependent peptidase [Bacteroidota bacterium]